MTKIKTSFFDKHRLKVKDKSRVYLHRLRQDDDSHGSCVDALHPGGEAHLRDPLHPVCSSFMLHMSVHVLPNNSDRCMM